MKIEIPGEYPLRDFSIPTKMNKLLLIATLIVTLTACNQKQIAKPADYNIFISDARKFQKELEKSNTELGFWSHRLKADTGNFVDMLELASNHIKRFKQTGLPSDLHIADSFYNRVLAKIKNTSPEIYFSIAQNAVTQHRFKDAWKALQLADSIGVNPYVINLLKFDVAMEIGLYPEAYTCLNKIKDEKKFDYLIRIAKLQDHNGMLVNAIEYMEKALVVAEKSAKKSLILWAKSYLADMYGHAGRVKESYKNYLDVLKIDSSYLYALKGIAWIAFSHDHNTTEAKRILNYILLQTNMPDLYLTLAEIAKYEGDTIEEDKNIATFLSIVNQPAYGNMYNKYLIDIYAADNKNSDKALALAEKEVSNRPTAETYGWLAWVNYKKGNLARAYELTNKFVINQSFEPHILLHAAFIYNASGNKVKAENIAKECLSSSYELGPVQTKELKKSLL